MGWLKKTITISELAALAENIIKNGEYPDIRSLLGFIEYFEKG